MRATFTSIACLAAAVLLAGCTVHQDEAPALTGPSEFALSVSMSASPDTLASGGVQQAAISVFARDAAGSPRANVTFRLNTILDGTLVDFGTLSVPQVVTGADGRGTAIYTIPKFSPFMAGTPSRKVTIVATPVGTDYNTAVPYSVAVLVIPPPVPTSVAGSPSASLLASATNVKVGQLVTFDASGSLAAPGASIVDYYWDFGDNLLNEEKGVDASHAWASPGTFTVVLGVVDNLGRIASTFKTIVVTP